MINVYQPSLGNRELEKIKEVFESNWIGKGKLTAEFEEKFASHIKSDKSHVVSTNCCSEGLFSSMSLFGIGDKYKSMGGSSSDEVIVPTVSFVGAGNAVCDAGAKLVLCDVDKRTLNTTAELIEKKITKNTKALLLLHYGGIPCEMDEIMALAKAHNLKVIEDCAPGVCSSYKGQHLGTIGDMGMWSFDAMKILVCGDGSILHFKDPEIKNKADKLLYFGLESKSGYSNTVDKKWWNFDISCFGHRAIMNDITASMALVQLDRLPEFMQKRKSCNDAYTEQLSKVEWLMTPPELPSYCTTSYYFYHIQLKNEFRDDLAKYLRDNGIYTTYRYYPLHHVSGYGVTADCPNADWAAEHTLNLPLHQSLSLDEVSFICDKIKEFGNKNNY